MRPLELQRAIVRLLYPANTPSVPHLHLRDVDDDGVELLEVSEVRTHSDKLFREFVYDVPAYLGFQYDVRFDGEADPRPWVLRNSSDLDSSFAVHGTGQWWPAAPARTVPVRVQVHDTPVRKLEGFVEASLQVGSSVPFTRLDARRTGTAWEFAFDAFPGISHALALKGELVGGDRQPRTFVPEPDVVLHTAPGISGLSSFGGPTFVEIRESTRRELLAAEFGDAIVQAGVFSEQELPQGAIRHGDEVWFVLHAPNASSAELILLSDGDTRTSVSMQLTTDIRYWVCSLPSDLCVHGQRYRFRLNGHQEVVDPAARWAHDPGYLWAKPGEKQEGPWALFCDSTRLNSVWTDAPAPRPTWESLIIYEMHPLRFSRRNAKLPPLQRTARELEPGGYLQRLGITAIELLPISEFSGAMGWGYNPSLFFAVDSSYGTPEDMVNLVKTAHRAGVSVICDVVFNHMWESPLQAVARNVYVDGNTRWGDMVNYDDPMCQEFFKQVLLYLWHRYRLDGFRFDATSAIVDPGSNPYVVEFHNGKPLAGSGGGWEFLQTLRETVRRAADASGRAWPYIVAEDDPNRWHLSEYREGVVDGQWHFDYHYRISEGCVNSNDKSAEIAEYSYAPQGRTPFYACVRYAESHDSVSEQEPYKKRVVAREEWGSGRRMAKAAAAAVVLSRGLPMLFMGQESGEDRGFFFEMKQLDDPSRYLDLDRYENDAEMSAINAWFRDLIGLRKNPNNEFAVDWDELYFGRDKTVAFSRASRRFVVIVTMGTPSLQCRLSDLGISNGALYKEIFNSHWPRYRLTSEEVFSNGGYDAVLGPNDWVHVPSIGAVVLERR